jgi:hypothetical protein
MTLVTHFYRPRRARKKKAAVAPTGPRIVPTIRRAPPPDEDEPPEPSAATEAQIPKTPRAKPSSIVTAKKLPALPATGQAAQEIAALLAEFRALEWLPSAASVANM